MRFFTRFTLRDLFFVVALAAVGCAWRLEHRKHASAIQLWESRANAAADVLTGEGWMVNWDERGPSLNLRAINRQGTPLAATRTFTGIPSQASVRSSIKNSRDGHKEHEHTQQQAQQEAGLGSLTPEAFQNLVLCCSLIFGLPESPFAER